MVDKGRLYDILYMVIAKTASRNIASKMGVARLELEVYFCLKFL